MFEVAPGVEEAYFSAEVSERVPWMLRTLCIVYFVLLLIGLLLMSNFEPSQE